MPLGGCFLVTPKVSYHASKNTNKKAKPDNHSKLPDITPLQIMKVGL